MSRTWLFAVLVMFAACLPAELRAQGGCGSVCIPLDALDPLASSVTDFDSAVLDARLFPGDEDDAGPLSPVAPGLLSRGLRGRSQVTFTSEFADFKNFREGEDRVFNMGGNDAYIVQSAMFVDYFASDRWTWSFLATHVKKDQFTNKFGHRQAIGFGDVAAFGRYELLEPCEHGNGPSVWIGLGVKFPTASLDEPTGQPRLPPAFQVGSGAHDLIPSISYYQRLDGYSIYGTYFARMPLERNRANYRFGQEHEVHAGVVRPLPCFDNKVSLLLSIDFLSAFRDSDFDMMLPARVRDGVLVKNTGGEFLNLSPGLSIDVCPSIVLQARFLLPVHQDWNGDRSLNVGQVAPDFTTQLTLSYRH